MTVNQSKVRELTEDWLHRWRSPERDDTENTASNPPRSNDIGVQTSFPLLIKEDSTGLISVEESATPWCKDVVHSSQKMETDSEAGGWSDDSLDSYTTEGWKKKNTSKYSTNDTINKETAEEFNAIVEPDSQSVGSYTSLWTSEPCIHRAHQSHCHGISIRNDNKSSPDVKTVFNYSRDFQEDKSSTNASTLVGASEEQLRFSQCRAPIFHSAGKFPSSSSPIPQPKLLSNSATADDLLNRLSTLIDKLRIIEWPTNCNTHCEPFPRTNTFSTFNQTNYCSFSLQHCKFCHKRNHRSHHHHCQHYLRCRTHHSVADQLSPSFESVMRAELLAIRRRMVARTASPKVAQNLSYLTQTPTKNFGQPYQMYDSFNMDDDNLPGEIWV